MTTPTRDKIKFNADNKFDLQLTDALINERRLGDIFSAKKIEKIELKSEFLALGADRQHLHRVSAERQAIRHRRDRS